jgi:hypothetical protein
MSDLAPLAPHHAPALVRLTFDAVADAYGDPAEADDALSLGVEVDALYAALAASRCFVEPLRAVLATGLR